MGSIDGLPPRWVNRSPGEPSDEVLRRRAESLYGSVLPITRHPYLPDEKSIPVLDLREISRATAPRVNSSGVSPEFLEELRGNFHVLAAGAHETNDGPFEWVATYPLANDPPLANSLQKTLAELANFSGPPQELPRSIDWQRIAGNYARTPAGALLIPAHPRASASDDYPYMGWLGLAEQDAHFINRVRQGPPFDEDNPLENESLLLGPWNDPTKRMALAYEVPDWSRLTESRLPVYPDDVLALAVSTAIFTARSASGPSTILMPLPLGPNDVAGVTPHHLHRITMATLAGFQDAAGRLTRPTRVILAVPYFGIPSILEAAYP